MKLGLKAGDKSLKLYPPTVLQGGSGMRNVSVLLRVGELWVH